MPNETCLGCLSSPSRASRAVTRTRHAEPEPVQRRRPLRAAASARSSARTRCAKPTPPLSCCLTSAPVSCARALHSRRRAAYQYHCCTERRELVGCCCRCRCRYRCARRRGGVRPSSCIHACSRGSTAEAASAAASARSIGRADRRRARVTKVIPQISTKHVAEKVRRWLARDAAVDGRIGDVENLDERRRAAEDAGHRRPSASHRRRRCPRRCGRPRRSAVRLPQHRAHRRGASRSFSAGGRATGRCRGAERQQTREIAENVPCRSGVG